MKKTFTIGTASIEPGGMGFGKLLCEPLADSAEAYISLIVIHGSREGPVLWLGSTIHGREIPGIEVIRRVAREKVDPQQLRGTLVCAMPLNPYGFRMQQHVVPQDGGNVNAKFPGNASGTLSERLAHVIWTEGVMRCDYVIDLHANEPGGMEFLCVTTCEDKEIERRTIEMAEAFGFPCVRITREMWNYDHSLIGWAMDAGKPAILPEPLAQGILEESSIQAAERGILNVMKYIGMVDGQVEHQASLRVDGGHYLFVNLQAQKSGLAEYWVEGGDKVEEGQTLAMVRDPWGNELQRIVSPTGGFVRSVSPFSIVNAGQVVVTLLEPHERRELWGF